MEGTYQNLRISKIDIVYIDATYGIKIENPKNKQTKLY